MTDDLRPEVEQLKRLNEEYRLALSDAVFALEVMRVQLSSWGVLPACNAEGIETRARAALQDRASSEQDASQ